MNSKAVTIIAQLGHQALYMIGAKNFIGGETDLTFKIGRNAKSVSHIRITLDASDTYTVEAIRVRKSAGLPVVRVLETCSDVYADCLKRTIESFTGMYMSL